MILGCAEPITCLELMVYRKSLPFGLSQNHFKTFQIISWRVFGLFSRPRESLVEAATKGFGAPSDAFAPNFAMRRRFAAGTFARAIFYRAHQMPFGLKESPESGGLREAPQLVSTAPKPLFKPSRNQPLTRCFVGWVGQIPQTD